MFKEREFNTGEEYNLYLQKLEESFNHNFEEDVTEFFRFVDFKARAITISDDIKNLSEDSFFDLYNVYIQISRLYILGLLQNVKNKRFYSEEDKTLYKLIKKDQLSTISIYELEVRNIKLNIKIKEIQQIMNKQHEKKTKEIKKFFNYKVDDKIAMDYLAKIFDRLVLHVPEEKLKKILRESGWFNE